MILENAIFWQAIAFMLWGYITAWMVYALVSVPSRLIESA